MTTNINYELYRLRFENRNNRPIAIKQMLKDAERYVAYTKVKRSIDVDIIVEDKEDFLNDIKDTLINM